MQTTDRTPLAEQIAIGLGFFSLGLGLAELIAPGTVAQLIGVPPTRRARSTVRAIGVREIGTGLSALARPSDPMPVWSRVAGDVVDLALLGAAFVAPGAERSKTIAATAAVLGVGIADLVCALELRRRADGDETAAPAGAVQASAAITIARPLDDVYKFWSNYENFSWFMRNLESVRVTGERQSHWTVRGPAGLTVEWDAEIVSDQENHMISWRSLPGSQIENHGAVRFEQAPGARGTEVHVELEYSPPAGQLGHAAAWLFGASPRQQMREGLKRVKQLLEVGEVPFSDGPGLARPAQPPAAVDTIKTLAGVEP